MPELFCLRTSHVEIRWSGPSEQPREEASASGTLRVHPRRPGLELKEGTQRRGLAGEAAKSLTVEAGPPLFEETSYELFVRALAPDAEISLGHRDPRISASLSSPGDSSLLHGSINFRSQIGESRFVIHVDGEPELDFTVEVFPSKITYREDFAEMMGRVQDLATGLALEYLRATHHFGEASEAADSSRLEWLELLRHLLDDLERALQHVANRPVRGLQRRSRMLRAEKLRRADHTLRKALLRDRGRGPRQRLKSGIPVRTYLPEQRAQQTLDTPEHRWLDVQVSSARRRLATIIREEEDRQRTGRFSPSATERQAIVELRNLEERLARLSRLEPLDAATRPPPAGFTSLQLQGAPGYREAFRSLTILQRGLRIGGGPVELSLKDLHLLYEYWCFLEIVHRVAEALDHPIPARKLVEVRSDGLRLRLKQGRTQTVPFELPGDRSLEVTYNPTFQDNNLFLPQRPDIVLTFRDSNWPIVRLVLDAKYRLQQDAAFLDQFGSPGPPSDAVNVLHRYRDAILEKEVVDHDSSEESRASRTVVEGAALFPLDDEGSEGFEGSKFWEGLRRLGVGALPFLPSSTRFVEQWLRRVLARSGWETAKRAPGYEIRDSAQHWKKAAEEPVLVGVLRGRSKNENREHLDWVISRQVYYAPLTPSQRRQLQAQWVAIYSPSRIRASEEPGAVTHLARVREVTVLPRDSINTPWRSRRSGKRDSDFVVFQLNTVEKLARPVPNRGLGSKGGSRFSSNRWTSRLSLDRSRDVGELLLESHAEWVLYERLRAEGRQFHLQVDRAPPEEAGREGRAWFVLKDRRVRWAGVKGWEVRREGAREFVASLDLPKAGT